MANMSWRTQAVPVSGQVCAELAQKAAEAGQIIIAEAFLELAFAAFDHQTFASSIEFETYKDWLWQDEKPAQY